jgi:hypothetical protein
MALRGMFYFIFKQSTPRGDYYAMHLYRLSLTPPRTAAPLRSANEYFRLAAAPWEDLEALVPAAQRTIYPVFHGDSLVVIDSRHVIGNDWYWFPEPLFRRMVEQGNYYATRMSASASRLLSVALGIPHDENEDHNVDRDCYALRDQYAQVPLNRDACLAVAMASHPRLGAASALQVLVDQGMLQMLFELLV